MDDEFEVRDLRKNQYFRVDDEYLNGYARLCGINATGVYLSLCRHVDKEQKCFPSKKLMAEELSISERSVYNAIKTLEEWKIIKVQEQERKTDGSFKNNVYFLTDKTKWKPKPVKQDTPQANDADGKIEQIPQANDDSDRRHLVPKKYTHTEVNTYKKEETIFPLSVQEIVSYLVDKRIPESLAKQETLKFLSYWTEPSKTGKLRWQGEKYFDPKRRLATWFSRIKERPQGRERKIWTRDNKLPRVLQ